jgi:hypothetical protein
MKPATLFSKLQVMLKLKRIKEEESSESTVINYILIRDTSVPLVFEPNKCHHQCPSSSKAR